MIELFILFLAFSPFDWETQAFLSFNDDYLITKEGWEIVGEWHEWDDGTFDIIFYGAYWERSDDFGNTAWKHEWLHIHCGNWHTEKTLQFSVAIIPAYKPCLEKFDE